MKKIFITGITGFAGSFLAGELVKNTDYQVHGTYLTDASLQNVHEIKDKLTLHKINLSKFSSVNTLLKNIKPDIIFHLAALTSVADSFKNATPVVLENIGMQMNILNSMMDSDIQNSRLIIISSAEIYGSIESKYLPITEETPIRPNSPYAVSKATQDLLGLQYFLSNKLDIVRVRPFNHIGPKQAPSFVVSSFAKQIAQLEKSEESTIKVGNLESKRDFTDVRDMVKAYQQIAEKGESGEVYNVGRGESFKIQFILDSLLKLTDKKISVIKDKSLMRPVDTPEVVADNSKVQKQTGWKPTIPLEQTLKDTLDYWRNIS